MHYLHLLLDMALIYDNNRFFVLGRAMYQYSYADQAQVDARVAQFADQTKRFLAGELSEERFLPLRLQNGLYIQRHAPMLRVAIPYGLLSADQMQMLAEIADQYDKGYGHFTTRTNIQYNWVKLEEVPEILGKLASVQMHAIQTSGNCIRNTTTDPYAGVIEGEIEDPRPYCEIIRQWSTFHPEFAYLPRKFKMAVIGTQSDRAAAQLHDIGIRLTEKDGEVGFEILVGGGLGRTPIIGKSICEFLPKRHLLTYLDAILRVYNFHGRRDNKYKARIKILVESMGKEAFAQAVERVFLEQIDGDLTLTDDDIAQAISHFSSPDYARFDPLNAPKPDLTDKTDEEVKRFNDWMRHNTVTHKRPGYHIVVVSLKAGNVDGIYQQAGDLDSAQMRALADLARRYSFGEIRATHHQNLVLADVATTDLVAVYDALRQIRLARPNIGTLTDMIVCPGFDYCALANATTHNVASAIDAAFDNLDYLYDLGDIRLNMSGCMNACAHHHVGDIGILGVDKKGEHWYQISLGGSSGEDARLGKILGRAVAQNEVADTIATIARVYIDNRQSFGEHLESFAQYVARVGLAPFKDAVYNKESV